MFSVTIQLICDMNRILKAALKKDFSPFTSGISQFGQFCKRQRKEPIILEKSRKINRYSKSYRKKLRISVEFFARHYTIKVNGYFNFYVVVGNF